MYRYGTHKITTELIIIKLWIFFTHLRVWELSTSIPTAGTRLTADMVEILEAWEQVYNLLTSHTS
jgi:hypothetical protein